MTSTARLVSADWNFWPDGLDPPAIWRTSADLGFSAMELGVYRTGDELSSSAVTSIEALASETGLGVAAVLFSMPPARWPDGGLGSASQSARAVAEIAETARRASDLGADVLGGWPGADAPTSPDADQWPEPARPSPRWRRPAGRSASPWRSSTSRAADRRRRGRPAPC